MNFRKKKEERRTIRFFPDLRFAFKGRRKDSRRDIDAKKYYFIDQYSPQLFAFIIAIIIMSVLDYGFTMIHLANGAIEANPVMAIAIEYGDTYFFFIKYLMTTVGLFILCLYKNFFPTKRIMILVFSVYFLLTIYHISCLYIYKAI